MVSFAMNSDGGAPRVAYAIGRGVGPAVRRNRLRRRLRSIVHAERDQLAPGGLYLFGAHASAGDASFATLEVEVRDLLAAATAGAR